MFNLKCQQCGKDFDSKSSTKKYCSRECFYKSNIKYEDRDCPICGIKFHPEALTQKYCSHKCLGLAQRVRDEKECLICGKKFYSRNNGDKQKYCSKECYTQSQITVVEKPCKYCGKIFRGRKNESKFCSKECQMQYWKVMPIEEKEKIMKNLSRNKKTVSKLNKEYKQYLINLGYNVEFANDDKKEFELCGGTLYRKYDIKVGNTLIELNPYPYHNSTWAPMEKQGNEPLPPYYHYNKLKLAKDNGYRCIMVWDWDDYEKIPYLLEENKTNLYARKCEVKQIAQEECHNFFESYHLQGDTQKNKNNIYIGLYYNNELVECMSFGKPRYNKNYEREILRLCSHKDYKIVGGANKIFKKFLEIADPNNVVSYCDMSKFDGGVYKQLGFKLLKWNKPSKHYYNPKEKPNRQHITYQLLKHIGIDNMFGENFGKGTDNDELMRQRGYVEIYDCGQSTFVWAKE